jgi:hypothetical protein
MRLTDFKASAFMASSPLTAYSDLRTFAFKFFLENILCIIPKCTFGKRFVSVLVATATNCNYIKLEGEFEAVFRNNRLN